MTISIKNSIIITTLLIILTILALVFCQRVFYFVDMQEQRQSVYSHLHKQQINAHILEQTLVNEEQIYNQATQHGFLDKPNIHQLISLWKRLAQQCDIKDITFNIKPPCISESMGRQTVIMTIKADLDSDVFKFLKLLEQQKNIFTLAQEITLFRDKANNLVAVGSVHAQIVCDNNYYILN